MLNPQQYSHKYIKERTKKEAKIRERRSRRFRRLYVRVLKRKKRWSGALKFYDPTEFFSSQVIVETV